MPKAKANSKKASKPSTSKAAVAASAPPLFEIDTVGSSTIRRSLLAPSSRQPSSKKERPLLKSERLLLERSDVPALEGKARKRDQVDKKAKERMRKLTGRQGKGEGLWGLAKEGKGNEALVQRVQETEIAYDPWQVQGVEGQLVDEDRNEQLHRFTLDKKNPHLPKIPTSLRTHALLDPSSTPRSIPLPHPGQSYNPSHDSHQQLLSTALSHYSTIEEREQRLEQVSTAHVRSSKELWEVAEEEVGSGEEDDDQDILNRDDGEAIKKKQPKRKTRQQRTKALANKEQLRSIAAQKALKSRTHSIETVKKVLGSIDDASKLSLEEKAAKLRERKERLSRDGLTRFRSGQGKVPDAPIHFQLGDELSESLRGLNAEGNLWRDWVASGMRRGKVVAEKAYEGKNRGGKRGRGKDKGSKTREVEKHSYKNWKA